MKFIEIPQLRTLLIISDTNREITYMLSEDKEQVNQQQFNLPEGSNITYNDGSKILHCGNYALLRHWTLPNGKVIDRVALRWNNLYL